MIEANSTSSLCEGQATQQSTQRWTGDNWIEFMLNIPADASHKDLGVQNHFSLGVRDIKTATAKLKANGLKTNDGPEIGRDGKWSFDIYDPDDSRVELMEFTTAQDPCCHPYTAPHPKP